MPPLRFPVAVIMQRVPLTSRWADERWEALAVEPCEDPLPAQTVVSDTANGKSWRCTGQVIELHPAEAEGYYLNVRARAESVRAMAHGRARRRCRAARAAIHRHRELRRSRALSRRGRAGRCGAHPRVYPRRAGVV